MSEEVEYVYHYCILQPDGDMRDGLIGVTPRITTRKHYDEFRQMLIKNVSASEDFVIVALNFLYQAEVGEDHFAASAGMKLDICEQPHD